MPAQHNCFTEQLFQPFVQITATAKTFLSGCNFYQFDPNLQNKNSERCITTTKKHLPDCRFVSFIATSRCQHYSRAKHVFHA